MTILPISINASGYIPQTPQSLNQQLINNVAAVNPGYTANLPASLIEDISSTDTYALLQCDSAIAEIINCLSPNYANAYLLQLLGNMIGISPQVASNTSVYVVFTGTPGFVVIPGFVISDGTYQYVIQDGGIVNSSGVTQPLYAIATVTGSWAVQSGTVNQLVTSVPS